MGMRDGGCRGGAGGGWGGAQDDVNEGSLVRGTNKTHTMRNDAKETEQPIEPKHAPETKDNIYMATCLNKWEPAEINGKCQIQLFSGTLK